MMRANHPGDNSNPSNSNSGLSKAEIERRRRARVNSSLDQLKMFHLTRSPPNAASKLEKIEIMDMTINYIKSVSNEQRKGAEKAAYEGFKNGFQMAQQAVRSYIYGSCDATVSAALVAAVNAKLAAKFDESFKSLQWLRNVYRRTGDGSIKEGANSTPKATPTLDLSLNGGTRTPINFTPLIHSTPIHRFRNIPPLFNSPESLRSSGSLSLSLSSSLEKSAAERSQSNSINENSNISNDDVVELVCVTCEEHVAIPILFEPNDEELFIHYF